MSALYVLALLVAGGVFFVPFALLARRMLPGLPGGGMLLLLLTAATLYFVEHMLWLGTGGLWLLWLLLAGTALGLNRDLASTPPAKLLPALRLPPAAVMALILAVLWPLAWRFSFPSLYASSEKLTNLLFLQNFLYADSLPAVDRWLPPYKFDFYYPLQYYLMSLPGRMLNLPATILYQSGFVLFIAATIFAGWRLAYAVLGSTRKATVVALALSLGGTGASLVTVPWHYQTMTGEGENPAFVGLTAEARFNGKVFHKIFGENAGPTSQHLPAEQPLEYFAYQIFLGDFHPTLSGFFLALALLALLFHLSRSPLPAREERTLLVVLGMIPLVMLASNSWMFPHAVLVAGGWFVWRTLVERDADRATQRFVWMAAGALLSLLIFLPHLQGLSARTLGIGIKFVPSEYRGSPWPYLIQWWPLLLVSAVAAWTTRLRTISGYIGVAALVLMTFNGLVYVNDLSVDVFERTNSAMKWWSWTWAFGMTGGLIALLSSEIGKVRILAIALAVMLLLPALPLLDQLLRRTGDDVGKIYGDHIYMRDHTNKSIVLYLRQQAPGIAIENVKANAYDDSGALSLMGNKAVFLGWPDHQYTWRGGFGEVNARKEPINQMYEGRLPDAGAWAHARDIEFIVWSGRECRESGGKDGQSRMDATLRPQYAFHRTELWGDCPVGVWRPRR